MTHRDRLRPTTDECLARRPGSGRRLAARLVPALVASCMISGCGSGRTNASNPFDDDDPNRDSGLGAIDLPDPAGDRSGVAWLFWPERVRIYPLTRVVHDEGADRWYVEARVEFLDELGDSSKACGTVELAIFDEPASGGRTPIDTWTSDLRTITFNARSYDPVTRTYLYKLDVPADILDRDPVLYVRHDSLDGRIMTDRLALRTAR